ncbi:MAG TPA: YraN family protein [Epsilonproteobacteria bacterium]|nr:YraN family protein [Campylobacterota bacterium]
MNNTKQIGDANEGLATRYLETHGFSIVERNYYARKLGEIDIIASKAGVLHFIEVKSGDTNYDPIYNFTPSKIRKVINSAQYFLKERKLNLPLCIDALVVRKGKVELIENITL